MIQEISDIEASGTSSSFLTQDSTVQSDDDSFAIEFEDLLKIVLTQLTYQDPLKPVENFEFVSQLAQFTQIQQGETISDSVSELVEGQYQGQATGLLGAEVDVPAGSALVSGRVVAVSIQNGTPRLTIETADDQTISNISVDSVSQIRVGED